MPSCQLSLVTNCRLLLLVALSEKVCAKKLKAEANKEIVNYNNLPGERFNISSYLGTGMDAAIDLIRRKDICYFKIDLNM